MSATQNLITVYSQISGAVAVAGIGQKVISKKWNKTTQNPIAFERAVILPMECVSAGAGECSDTLRPLVQAALISAAVSVLKTEMEVNPNNSQLPDWKFNRPALIEEFLGADSWLDKDTLAKGFDNSASWKKLIQNPKYSTMAVYKQQADSLRDNILKLAGKATQFSESACDKMIVRILDEDAETEVGSFILRRLVELKTKAQSIAADFDALD